MSAIRTGTRAAGVARLILLATVMLGAPAVAAPSATQSIPNTLVNASFADQTSADTQSGTALVVGSDGRVICAFNDTGSHLFGAHFVGIARSTDFGDSWIDQGTLPNDAVGDAGSPVLARSALTGTLVLTALGLNNAAVVQAYRSTDGGATYQPPNNAAGFASQPERAWITCDNTPGAGFGNFYVAYADVGSPAGIAFTSSVTDGSFWTQRTLLSTNGSLPWVVVGADHAVYCFWLTSTNQIVFRKSPNLGVSFESPATVATLRTTGSKGDLGLGGGFRTPAGVQVVAHPTDANRLFAVWADRGEAPGTDKANVYLSQTLNGGTTWSAPERVNTDAGSNDNWQPVIAISPDGLTLFVSWYDRRLDPGNSLIDVYARHAAVSGSALTFGADYRVTDTSFPVARGQDPSIASDYMGDYDVAAANDESFFRTWGDNRFPSAVHAHQPDVLFARIPKTGPRPVLAASGSSLLGESCAPPNGAPDPNERVTYSLALVNRGTESTTNLVATLLSGGGAEPLAAPQSFGALPPGGAPVARPFTFRTTAACAGVVNATLQLQDGAANLGTVSFRFPVGVPGGPLPPVLRSSGNIAVPVPATGTSGDMTDQVIPLTDAGFVDDLNVRIRLNHTYDGDLTISLVSPSGDSVTLCSRRGGSGGNFGAGASDCSGTATVFDDEAVAAIGAGSPPYSGSFRPESPLATFDGTPVAGTWTLKIRDDQTGDYGTLFCWSLDFARSAVACNTCAPAAAGEPAPASFAAWPNEPNPFTRTTWIRYSLPKASPVDLSVYTVQGRRIATLVHEVQSAGTHSASFGPGAATATGESLDALAPGVYFYRLRAGSWSGTRKMLFVR